MEGCGLPLLLSKTRSKTTPQPEILLDRGRQSAKGKIPWRLSRHVVARSRATSKEGFRLRQYVFHTSRRFGSPSANCVIPLTAFAPLPPSISLRLNFFGRRDARDPGSTVCVCDSKRNFAHCVRSITAFHLLATRNSQLFSQKLFFNRVLQLIFLFSIIRK